MDANIIRTHKGISVPADLRQVSIKRGHHWRPVEVRIKKGSMWYQPLGYRWSHIELLSKYRIAPGLVAEGIRRGLQLFSDMTDSDITRVSGVASNHNVINNYTTIEYDYSDRDGKQTIEGVRLYTDPAVSNTKFEEALLQVRNTKGKTVGEIKNILSNQLMGWNFPVAYVQQAYANVPDDRVISSAVTIHIVSLHYGQLVGVSNYSYKVVD